jgi:DNA invertase Pin-like site-specific DNA recombinase
LKQRGVKFRSLAEAIDTNTATGRAMWQMIGVLAELKRSLIAERTRVRREVRDPVAILRRKVRSDAGRQDSVSPAIREALRAQYAAHPSWSTQLHYDNLRAQSERDAALAQGPL